MNLLEDEHQWKEFLRHHGYRLHHQIGCGSFGDVFCVTMMSDKESSATKHALKRLVTRRNILDDNYVMIEIHSLLQLQHQNIVSVHEIFLTKNVACIVMELAPLGNLEMLFKDSKTSITKRFITLSFSQILNAIEFCHGLSLAHRDINPTNVLVCSLSLVKLADFGLCFQCRDDLTGESLLCSDYLGQEKYTAPEVKLCAPFKAMPADIWSLGCLLSYLATNSHCFNIENPTNTQFKERQLENLENDNEIVGSYLNLNANCERCKNVNHEKVKRPKESLIRCLRQKLCRHSWSERPLIGEVVHDWSEISREMEDDSIDYNCSRNNNLSTTNHREE